MNKLPILMTASVSTRGMVGADFTDEEREKMYLETLTFYGRELLGNDSDRKIVFAENSGWDLDAFNSRLACKYPNQIEFVPLNPEEFDISKGKGYNELLLISKAIRCSKSLKESNAFLKVTGRYPIYNLSSFLGDAEEFFCNGGALYCDMKDHSLYDIIFRNPSVWNGHKVGTGMFASTVNFFTEKLGPLYTQCNDYEGKWVECVWYDALQHYRQHPCPEVSLRFKVEPEYGGMQGSNNSTFTFSKNNQSPKKKIMRFVGNILRRYVPSFWF